MYVDKNIRKLLSDLFNVNYITTNINVYDKTEYYANVIQFKQDEIEWVSYNSFALLLRIIIIR